MPDVAGRQFAKVALLAGILAMAGEVRAADWSLPVTGNLLGTVVDGTGNPQLGARVKLFNKYDRLVAKTLSSADGRFAFAGLAPDFYSLRVSLDSFVPAFRDKIAIRPGVNSMLQINMATLFSSIQFNSSVPAGAMSNDWKWVLRSSPSTRPITRFLPVDDEDDDAVAAKPELFSNTRMLLGVMGGDAGFLDGGNLGSDVGTQFALSTSVYGRSVLQLAGRMAQSNDAALDTFAICAIYTPGSSLGLTNSPEVALTVSQVRMLGTAPGSDGGTAMLRAMTLSVYQTADPTDDLHLEFGMTGESVDLLQHSSRISPFARATVDLGRVGTVVAAYSDGGRPDELTEHAVAKNQEPEELLDDTLAGPVEALARSPQISVRNDRLRLQRTQNAELGYHKTLGSRTYAFSTFYEKVWDGRMNVAGDMTQLAGNLLSDGVSTTSIFNIGNYNRNGYLASIDQKLGENATMQIAYGRMGGFTAADHIGSDSISFLSGRNHNVMSLGVRARVPKAGMRISARYGWTDPRASVPDHIFTTQNILLSPGFNVIVRQPLPSFFGMPGHLELLGDVQNLFSEDYLPLTTADGRQLLLVQSPKAIRGGLSITF